MSTKINASQLNQLLRTAQVTVAFTKQDGSERVMKCTLQNAYLPERTSPDKSESLSDLDAKATTFVVWDLDENDWRSFKVNSVKSVIVAGFQYSPAKSMLLG